jgi:FkbM family methyltransferase
MKEALHAAMKFLLLNYLPGPVLRELKKLHYARKLKTYPLDRERDMLVLRHIISPGDFVVDIGANVGLYTKALSELVGEHGIVYSIEPVPETYAFLVSNVRKLGLGNVVSINSAVSGTSGTVTMFVPRHLGGADNYYRAHITRGGEREGLSLQVDARTMDALFQSELGRFSFVKCDVEGHELECIHGARGFLARSNACWLIEVTVDPDTPQSRTRGLFHELSSHGYTPWWFDGKRLHERKAGDVCMNYFFLKPRHIEAIVRRNGDLLCRA